jgi:hypothetical protein
MPEKYTCSWCGGQQLLEKDLCRRCEILALQALELARQIALLIPKGGIQLYIGIEKTGQSAKLLNVKRWNPLEPLESADSVEPSFHTFQLGQE